MWYYVAYVYNGELISLIGNQRVGIFPPKSEIVFVLSLALIWCRNFQNRTIPVGGDRWSSCTSERRKNKNNKNDKNNERDTCWLAFAEVVRKNHGNIIAGRSSDSSLAFKQIFNDYGEIWKESRWKVTQLLSEVRQPSADCQSTFSRRFKPLGILLKKSLNGHATVVGGYATVGRLSNNDFSTFQAIRIFWKSRWTVTRQWSEVTRPSADCQTTFFGRFKRFGKIFEKSRWTVTRQWSEVTRPSADCQTTFFGRFKRFGKILKKVAERSRDSGWGHATVGRLSNNVFWTFQAIWENFEKSRWTVTQQWMKSRDRRPTVKQRFFGRFKQLGKFLKKVTERSRDSSRRSRDRRPTVKQRFLDVSSDLRKFWKKSLNGHATVVGGHATVGWLSNNVFSTFQAIIKKFEKSRWTVTRQWSEVTRPSADCQTTFLDVSSDLGKFWKKSLNGHATVVGGHATVG